MTRENLLLPPGSKRQPTPEEIELHQKAQKNSLLMQLTTKIFIEMVGNTAYFELALEQRNILAWEMAKSHLDFMLQKEGELNAEIANRKT